MNKVLSIHILGHGFGESIILSMPNGSVGVIDCYSPLLKVDDSNGRICANPTLRFLRNTLRADRLAFLGFTHPHEDHGRGLSHLLEEYKDHINEIWIYDAFQNIALERYFFALLNGKRKLPIERLLEEKPGTFSVELLHIRRSVILQTSVSNPARAKVKTFKGPTSVRIDGEPITIHFLGPSVAIALKYEAELIDNLSGVVAKNGDGVNDSWKPDAVNHNLASPSLLVEYGDTRLMLGGDMETQSWTEALRDNNQDDLAVQFVKVSHHGSETGYAPELYDQFGRNGRPIAVLTPFNRHKRPLPRREGVDHLKARTSELWTTSLGAAHRALGIEDPLSDDEFLRAKPVLERWKLDLDKDPKLWGAFDPTFVEQQGITDAPETLSFIPIPEAWSKDLTQEPRLAVLLHPNNRNSYLPQLGKYAPLEDAYRLSFSFRDDGVEITEKRYVGIGCGQLT